MKTEKELRVELLHSLRDMYYHINRAQYYSEEADLLKMEIQELSK